ncbi:FHA domain-containing protein [Cellulomonas persica]|uniref:FHA domain-containing protein n=1 Tax=Cellulomonas persica TaxID=76861 RepID=A0A510UQJ6_9CELL|nr:FHA domain-containing protein [Cellulomonas persica]GEK16756.1 hypothetical protein CPE01_04890 [Cellulomonas persica]
MSTVVCPEGHASASTDYCDVCGAPITSAAPGAAPATSAPAAADPTGPSACPHCSAPAAPGALFCENCGYDFTTGATPAPVTPLTPPGAPQTGPVPTVSAPRAPAEAPTGPATGQTPAVEAAEPATDGTALPTPAPAGSQEWVAEVWIDPDWYALQQPEDPLPSVGLPVLVPLRTRSVLVGRPSTSRNIHPQIDCGADSGVSRRHCQLNTDGQRWWVEDLQSSNGTYLARVGDALPTTPVPVGQRHEIADGDRVYVGAWTRIVVRHALPGEV